MALPKELVDRISLASGLSPDDIKGLSPSSIRDHLTKKTGKKFRVLSMFPTIGRGNVLREGGVTSEQINKEVDAILGS